MKSRLYNLASKDTFFNTPAQFGGVQGIGMSKKKKCDLQFLQFLWPSSINVCLELKCGNPEIVVCAPSAATPIL